MGPAMSIEAPAQNLVRRLLECLEDSKSKSSVILDADAINAFRNNHKGLKHKGLDILVTPHYGELARISPVEISANEIAKLSPLEKIKLLRHFTKATGCNILLKGSPSILVDAKTQQAFVLPYGNSGLAKAGSGDCLSGIITAMAAQIARRGESHKLAVSSRAALVAAFLLGKTAETIAPEYGEYSISASKIIANLHKILKAF
jgi:NAD(P)H-hydrate epimerase